MSGNNNFNNSNYSMMIKPFVSPLRGIASAAVPTNQVRGMSSSPYGGGQRKKGPDTS